MCTVKIPVGSKCAICGEDDPRILKEVHHLFGRANSPVTLVLCRNHHDMISYDQGKMPPASRNKSSSDEDKRNFMLISIGSYLEISGRQLKKLGMKKYNNSG